MKSKILNILVLAAVILTLVTACEKDLTRIVKQHYPNGQEKFVLYYDGEPAKETWIRAELYHENGQIMTIKRYKKGIQEGITESYYNDGSEMARMIYKNGKKNRTLLEETQKRENLIHRRL